MGVLQYIRVEIIMKIDIRLASDLKSTWVGHIIDYVPIGIRVVQGKTEGVRSSFLTTELETTAFPAGARDFHVLQYIRVGTIMKIDIRLASDLKTTWGGTHYRISSN